MLLHIMKIDAMQHHCCIVAQPTDRCHSVLLRTVTAKYVLNLRSGFIKSYYGLPATSVQKSRVTFWRHALSPPLGILPDEEDTTGLRNLFALLYRIDENLRWWTQSRSLKYVLSWFSELTRFLILEGRNLILEGRNLILKGRNLISAACLWLLFGIDTIADGTGGRDFKKNPIGRDIYTVNGVREGRNDD